MAGTIYFNAGSEGKSGSAALQADGSYKLGGEFGDKIPLGSYKVSLSPPSAASSADPSATTPGADPTGGSLPAKYLSGDTSGWSADVKAGENTFDFKVE